MTLYFYLKIMNISQIPSPSFVIDESLLIKNLELMEYVQKSADVSIILAFKGFAMWSTFSVVRKYLKGATASSLNEARLCVDEMKCKAHTYAPVYLPSEIDEVLSLSSHICFNSISQYELYKSKAIHNGVSIGLRVNPEYSDIETDLYNPCSPGSRLGIMTDELMQLPEGVEGLHFHALCESDSYSLERVLAEFEKRFGHLLDKLKWVNLGGGHLMTRREYDVEHLISVLKNFKQKYNVEVILEPGSAVAWDTGILVATVLDIVERKGIKTALLDVSFSAHMPDTIEMPYRPRIRDAYDYDKNKPSYRIGGLSCLSGDYMNEYSFDTELEIGQKLVFEDMIHYTMVKTTMFNGVTHPSIAIWHTNNSLEVVRQFGYDDYKNRLS
jgi:carboxynorspermidine decarboxylase